MKIVRIIARLNVGGPARHVVWLTSGLPRPEFEGVLVAGTVPEGEEDMAYFAAQNGVEPVFITELSRELSPKDIISLVRIYGTLRRERPDVVHTHTAKAGTVGRIAAFLYRWLTPRTLIGRPNRVKIVHTFHGHVFHSYYGRAKTGVFLMIERCLARFATDRIVVISDQQLNEINGTYRVGRRTDFTVIPLGLDLDAFQAGANESSSLRRELGIAADVILIGFSGRLTEIKNVGLLLDAVAEYFKAGDVDAPPIHLAIIGDGSLRPELEARTAALDIGHAVTFLGNRGDIETIIGDLDIFALTSKNEGTPLSMIEAMAAGVPVISTAVGGVVDLLGQTTTAADSFRICERGIAIDTAEPRDLAGGLIYLAKNEKLRASLAENSVRFVNAQYSKTRLIDDMSALYRELVSR